MNYGKNFYNHLPLGVLADFYVEIQGNIEKKILSEAMYVELNLIKEAAEKQGVSVEGLLMLSTRYNKNSVLMSQKHC